MRWDLSSVIQKFHVVIIKFHLSCLHLFMPLKYMRFFISIFLELILIKINSLMDAYNQSQKLLRLAVFLWKSPKKCFKDTQNSHSSWFNVVPSLEKLCQAAVAGMTKKTCNQHWIREQGVQVSLFLWLIVERNS